MRRAPLGFDRHHRAYWWGLASQRSTVYVQHEDGRLQALRSPQELASLMAGLDKRGLRELALFEALDKVSRAFDSIPSSSSLLQTCKHDAALDSRSYCRGSIAEQGSLTPEVHHQTDLVTSLG